MDEPSRPPLATAPPWAPTRHPLGEGRPAQSTREQLTRNWAAWRPPCTNSWHALRRPGAIDPA
eukprot:2958899-Pyramimonas_sp.AAC.1